MKKADDAQIPDKAAMYRKALSELVEIVDESLLLDDDLAQDWTRLCRAVRKARKVLDEQK